jgi:hypothetical protein
LCPPEKKKELECYIKELIYLAKRPEIRTDERRRLHVLGSLDESTSRARRAYPSGGCS